MVSSCSIYGCTARQNKDSKEKGICFFSYPRSKRQRAEWVKATNRKDPVTGELWEPGPGARVCSKHFEEGWMSDDPKDSNYRPTLFLRPASSEKVKPGPASQVEHDETESKTTGKTNLGSLTRVKLFSGKRAAKTGKRRKDSSERAKKKRCRENALKTSLGFHSYCGSHHESHQSMPAEDQKSSNSGGKRDVSVMTEENAKSYEQLQKKVCELEKEIQDQTWSYRRIEDDDAKTKFYTGLPTFQVFMWMFSFLETKALAMTYWAKDDSRSRAFRVALPLIDQLFATLMKLRLGLFLQDLADRFRLTKGIMNTIVTTWIFLLQKELEALNPCPSREILNQTMPPQYNHMKGLRFIIHCTEIHIESPSTIPEKNNLYSDYKHQNSVKFLVAISPTGLITYISEPCGGSLTDREIIQKSGFLDLLEQGDLVLADKDFKVGDLVNKAGAFLNISTFSQFTDQVYMAKLNADVRIHVERAMGRVKEYHILNGVLPLSLKNIHVLGSVLKVCCWLTNLQEPLVNPSIKRDSPI